MTTLEDYLDLVPSQHSSKPKFIAALSAILQPMIDADAVVASMSSRFDVDQASGDQLDAVGEWVGLSRVLRVPIAGVYFSFSTPGLGFGQGVWFDPDNPAEGIVSMDDITYRIMLKTKIAANSWDGSLGDANAKLAAIFGPIGSAVVLKDNMNMTQSFIVSGDAPSALFLQLVAGGYLDFKPAGVGIV